MTDRSDLDRRNFLKALAMTAVAATTTGGGAALLLNQKDKTAVVTAVESTILPTAVPQLGRAVTANGDASAVLAQLATAQAENLRLQSELDATRRRLEALQGSNGDVSQANEALQLELASANHQASLLAGLVALYQNLDELDLGDAVDSGLHNFGEAINGLVGELPTLEEGLVLGHAALDDLEAHIPLVQSGRHWLANHVSTLSTLYQAADGVLGAAVNTAGNFMTKINEWFQDVRKWLPFGVGDTAAEIMSALTALMTETPYTIQGAQQNVVVPLDVWLEGTGDDVPLRRKLIKPLKEATLSQATSVAGRVRDTETAYRQQLVEPLQTAAKSRQLVREEIEVYRKKYEM